MTVGGDSTDPPAERRRLSRRWFFGVAGVVVASIGIGIPVITRLGVSGGRVSSEPTTRSTYTVAHRGGSSDWPEMSMFAYQKSVALGVDALEISLARTSDGVWFGLHDATLDRTSGTTDFVAAEHTWQEVSEHLITAAGTRDPTQPSRPYLRLEDLITAYAPTHTIFVDPKEVPAQYTPELLAIMKSVPDPTATFVAKGYCTSATWARTAVAEGYRSWGYYYGAEVDSDAGLIPRTQDVWTMLGMDVAGSSAAWKAVRGFGKQVLGHIVATKRDEDIVVAEGASGIVVSGVAEVLG